MKQFPILNKAKSQKLRQLVIGEDDQHPLSTEAAAAIGDLITAIRLNPRQHNMTMAVRQLAADIAVLNVRRDADPRIAQPSASRA